MSAVTEPAPISDAEAERYLQSLIGRIGEDVTSLVEFGAVRRMALAIGDLDPIHFDEAAARARGHRGVVAPWPLLWLYFFTCTIYEHDFPFGKATVHGQDEYELHEPMVVGDHITIRTAMVDAKLKHGKTGRLGQVVSERRFTNQRGELCAVLRTTLFRR
ncbi:FAS1-like dehydratase domain-containing protein [Plastoroseomonas hellenica]|uniref:FAS1-like dehydratase domain-containing protein n=1 Tax=Plastoroseomonas hellenica TaxID=2687306 RepID=UPI001BAA85BC|nr:MaoC family dehydratase N-terminal domain-containing protein [Plastoroseomonas hellenica]MBR0646838.1 MaoC family dehydratase [Plastoroseomonas hellenica]